MNDIAYRRATKEDSESINNLFIEMIKVINKRMVDEGVEPYIELESGYEDGYLDTFYIDDNRVIFVAVENDTVVGFLSVVKKDTFLYLDDYCVTSKYRGMGIGSKLIETAEKFAISQNLEEVKLHVQTANHESREFYTSKGYTFLEEEEKRMLLGKKVR